MAIYMFGVSGEQTAMENQMKLDGLMNFVTAKIGHAYIGLIGTDISKIPVLAKLVTIAVLSLSLVIILNVFRRLHRSNADIPFFQRHKFGNCDGRNWASLFLFSIYRWSRLGQIQKTPRPS